MCDEPTGPYLSAAPPAASLIVGLYSDKAEGWIADRKRTLGADGPGLTEAGWFERFMAANGFPPDAIDPSEQDGHGVVRVARRS
jgi:ABC-type nitrate/sulfonate/bicarbonate transport system substrate-binding protein